MEDDFKFMCKPSLWYQGYELLIGGPDSRGRSRRVTMTVEVEENPDATALEPTMKLSPAEAQALINTLWDAGLRPTDGTGSAGQLKATETHLKDMREMSSKLLDNVLGRPMIHNVMEERK